MAGLVPAIHAFSSVRSARPGPMDSRNESGHDGFREGAALSDTRFGLVHA